jgi:hypothetical protein
MENILASYARLDYSEDELKIIEKIEDEVIAFGLKREKLNKKLITGQRKDEASPLIDTKRFDLLALDTTKRRK